MYVFFRFKHVLFEITAGDENGLFLVSGKFMGVSMEKVELVFQVKRLFPSKSYFASISWVFFLLNKI